VQYRIHDDFMHTWRKTRRNHLPPNVREAMVQFAKDWRLKTTVLDQLP
jgi:hypothetical protein